MVSDRAVKCPHCGNNPKEVVGTTQNATTEDEAVKNEASLTDATSNPVTSQAPQQAPDAAPEGTAEAPKSSSGSSKALVTVVIVLLIIAIGFGGYLWMGQSGGQAEPVAADTMATDTDYVDSDVVMSDSSAVEEEEPEQTMQAEPEVVADSNTWDEPRARPVVEEEGFHSDADVREFVLGNSYNCNGVTLRITEDAVFANGNEISQSRPVFKKSSKETGRITARPSISITVKRNSNKLIDNKSGDVYDFSY